MQKKLFVPKHLIAPGSPVKSLQLLELLFRKIETFPFNIFVVGHPPNWGFARESAAMRTIHDPFQHTHVLAEARPHKGSCGILTEPVHMKDARRLGERSLHADPMPE